MSTLVLLLIVVLALYALLGRWSRSERAQVGLSSGTIETTDDCAERAPTLRSRRYGLVGRPDQLIRVGNALIPVEQKPMARRVHQSHILQVAAHCLLVQEVYRIRPHAALPQKLSDRNEGFASDKNPTEGEVGEVQRASRYDLVRALAPRYAHVGKLEKGQLLDEVCQLTGYRRKHAVALLRHPPPDEPVVKRTRHRSASYGQSEVELLQLCWLVTDGICGKRLAPFLPELLRRLRHWHALRDVPAEVQARVAQMSAATVDRALRPYRTREGRRGISTTRPGALLKRQIAIRTFADWTDVQPGFLEMDLVAHCGWSAAGQFLYTLSMVDVATGWVACAGLRDRRQETVFSGLQRLQADLPFPILGLDSDNGGEFINRLLIGYCADQGITFTRGRPYAKNDSCHIEQKNWAVVRRLVGYDRLELPALPALERIHDLARDYVNFLHPVRKLVSKTRDGARVQRHYDAATTPFHRLVDSGVLSIQMTRELKARSANLDPIRLKVHLEAAQRTLASRAARSDPYVRQS